MNYHRVCPVCRFQYDAANRCLCDAGRDRFILRYVVPAGFCLAVLALLYSFLGDGNA